MILNQFISFLSYFLIIFTRNADQSLSIETIKTPISLEIITLLADIGRSSETGTISTDLSVDVDEQIPDTAKKNPYAS